ncbi:MAG: TldD/PmbA family protein [Nanoarchaeota archaeon]
MDKLLRELEKQGAKDIAIAYTKSDRTHLKFVNNDIITPMLWNQSHVEVFFSYKRRTAVVALQSVAGPKEVARRLIAFSASLPENKEFFGIAKGPFRYAPVPQSFDRRIIGLDGRAPVMVKDAIEAAKDAGAVRSSGVFEYGSSERHLLTSEGVDATAKGTNIYLSLRSFAAKDASSHQVRCGSTLSIDPAEAGKEAGQTAALAMGPKRLAPGTYDIVFEPLAFANLIDLVGSAASMFSVEAGVSFFAGALHKKVASPIITLFDDGRLADGFHSSPFDQEGVPTRRTAIIKEGVLEHYLYNTSLARKYHTKTTGNAGLVAPEPWNLVLKKGKNNKGQLIGQVKQGLLVTNLWYTRFQNYVSGQFSTVPRDAVFLIKDGEIAGPVRGFRISDVLPRMLSATAALGKDSRQVMCWETEHPVVTPHALVKGVGITTSTA